MIRFVEKTAFYDIIEIVRTMKKYSLTFDQAIKKRYIIWEIVYDVQYPQDGIRTEVTQLTFGRRLWFICPKCETRARKLFIVHGKLYCRKCAQLRYECQYYHRARFYETKLKYIRQHQKLEEKLKYGRVKKSERENLNERLAELQMVNEEINQSMLIHADIVVTDLLRKYRKGKCSVE